MPTQAAQASRVPGLRIFGFILRELREALPAIVFFAIGFNVIVLTTQLILYDYKGQFANFMVATMAALLVGKAVLVANVLPFFRRFDRAPLIQPILFKTIVYCGVVLVARILEQVVEYLIGGGAFGDIPSYVATHFTWHRFTAVQIWIFVLFLIYTTGSELNALFGHGELSRIFFTSRPSELQMTRRQHVRTLMRLDRLTKKHGIDELRDPATTAHSQMVGLLAALAKRRSDAGRPADAAPPE